MSPLCSASNSLITPPVAIAAFVAANIAGSQSMETAVQAVRIGWTALVVPVTFVMSPNLIMQGAPFDVLLAAFTALAGVWLVTAGILGQFLRPMTWVPRIACLTGGIALMIPSQAFPNAIYFEIGGAIVGLVVVAHEAIFANRTITAPEQ